MNRSSGNADKGRELQDLVCGWRKRHNVPQISSSGGWVDSGATSQIGTTRRQVVVSFSRIHYRSLGGRQLVKQGLALG